jgi:hypothetical protein
MSNVRSRHGPHNTTVLPPGGPSLDYPKQSLNVSLPRHERSTTLGKISAVKLLLLTLTLPAILIFFVTYSQINIRINGQDIVNSRNIRVLPAFKEVQRTGCSKPKVAYAISLIKCGDHQSTPEGMLDAATVLRHSVHQTSCRNPNSGSDYDYEMYVLVHTQAEKCAEKLSQIGYNIVVVEPPVNPKDIKGTFLRENVHSEWCCGSDEFIKLYAYNLTQHLLVVHLDIDFMMIKPMDKLFDALLSQGVEKQRPLDKKWVDIELQYPERKESIVSYAMQNSIDAAITRDYPDVAPGRIPGFQAGFIVLRPSERVLMKYIDIILEGHFVPGFEHLKNGWGGKGYGGFVGAKVRMI